MGNDEVLVRRTTALEFGSATADPATADPAEAQTAERLRLLLAHPATWTAAPPDMAVPEPVRPSPPEPVAAPNRTPARPDRRWWFRRPVLVLAAGALAVTVALLWLVFPPGGLTHESVRVELAGAGPIRDARASLVATEADSGWQITLDVEDLPGAPAGTYYEGWVTRPGARVPLGTFHVRGRDRVEMWSGVDITDFTGFMVTRQRVGGSQDPGELVLNGSIPR